MGDNRHGSRRWIDYLDPNRTTPRTTRQTRDWDQYIHDRFKQQLPKGVTIIKRDRHLTDNYFYRDYTPKREPEYIPTRRTFVPEPEYGGHHSSANPMKQETEERQDKSQVGSSYSGWGHTQGSRMPPYVEPYNTVKIKEEPADRGYENYNPTPSTSNYAPVASSSSAFTYTPSNHSSATHMRIKKETEERQDKSQVSSSYSGWEGQTQGPRMMPYEEPFNSVKIKEEPTDRGYENPTPSTINYLEGAAAFNSAYAYTPSNPNDIYQDKGSERVTRNNVFNKTGRKSNMGAKVWDWKYSTSGKKYTIRKKGGRKPKPKTELYTNTLKYQHDYIEYKRIGNELKESKKSSLKTGDSYAQFKKGGELKTVYNAPDSQTWRSIHEAMNNYKFRPGLNPGVKIKEEPRDNKEEVEEYNPARPFGWTYYRI